MIILLFLLFNFSYKIDGYFTWRCDKEFILHGSEIDFRFVFGEDYDRLLIFFQIPFASHFNNHFWQHYGDEYFYLKSPMGILNLKIGRFDIPFSLLKYYETHFLIFQPLYEDVLGYKKNIGVSFFGYLKDFLFDFNYSFSDWEFKNLVFTLRLGLDKEKSKFGFTFLKEKEKFAAFDINLIYLLFDLKSEFVYSFTKKKGIFFVLTFIPFWELETKFGYKYWEKENNLNLELAKDWRFLELKLGINYLFKKEFKPIIQGNFKI
ncbi:MAG: hypothetical protein ABIK78_00020 [candidate division WOR-3 bacterium]